MSTACESMPDTQPSGQGSCCSHKRPDEPGTLCSAYGVEQVVKVIGIVGIPGQPYKR
jgi:hypothetical protein